MGHFTKKLLPLSLIVLLLCSGCGGGGGKGNSNSSEPGGGNSWLVADTQSVDLTTPTARPSGSADWRDEIIYFIMTDRFSDGDSSNNGSFCNTSNINYYHGGDLKGIRDQVAYLRSLGATAVWITPVVENVWRNPHYSDYTGYHGYWPRDFTKLDSHLGSGTASYQSFVNTMHLNGLLVIQDIVINHMGPLAAYTSGWTPTYLSSGYTRAYAATLSSNLASSYNYTQPSEAPFNQLTAFHNYGKISNHDNSEQSVQGDVEDLPDLATDTDSVREELATAYGTWAGYGVDGFRVDTAKHVETNFWDNFCPKIRIAANGKNNFFQFGEFLIGYHPTVANYLNSSSGLDSALNYDLYYVMRSVFGTATDSGHGKNTSELTDEITRRSNYTQTSAQNLLVNFIDNHDQNRFLTDCGSSLDRMWLALTYIMTTKGIPCIYYNTENNVFGNSNSGRKDMPNFTTTNKKTFTLLRVLSKIRTKNISLRRGDIEVLQDCKTGPGIFAFVRYNGNQDENVFVLLNTSGSAIPATVPLSGYATNGATLRNILYSEFGQTDSITVANDSITVNIPAYSMKIFKK